MKGMLSILLRTVAVALVMGLTLTCFSVPALAQIPEVEWDRTFGGSDDDFARSVQQTSDGGYIIAGYTYSYGAGGGDIWLIKTDASGTKQWDRTFGGSGSDYPHSVRQTSDGGYIIAGFTGSYGAGMSDIWLIKTDSSGTKVWDRTFGGSNLDGGDSVQQTSDGGYIIAGDTLPFGAGMFDIWLIKTDSSGTKQWDKTFGGSSPGEGDSVQQTSDGGYIVAGYTEPYGAGAGDVWLIKTDASGNKEWDRTFGGSGFDCCVSVQQTSDGGYIVVGYTKSYGAGEGDVWLIKTDSSGTKQWDRTFGGSGLDVGFSGQQTSDGGYIVAGDTTSYGAGEGDVWLIKVKGSTNGQAPVPKLYTVDTNLKVKVSVAAQQLDDFIESKGTVWVGGEAHNSKDSPLVGLGQAWIDAGNKYGINSIYLMAHAIHESGWGFSALARDKHNIYGYGAYDADPYGGAYTFSSYEECIDKCAGWINTNYLTSGGKYYQGATLKGMNVNYATDTQWAGNIAEVMNEFANYLGWIRVQVHSPVELRVYDSQGRITGLVNGETKTEISNSGYYENMVSILSPSDYYRYQVVGRDQGSYGLTTERVIDQETSTFTAADIPTSTNAIHQYTIDWDALARGEKGVTVQIDSDGDGKFEKSITADSELTRDEFAAAVGKEGDGQPFWIWIAVGGGAAAVIGIGIVVWMRMARKAKTQAQGQG